MPRSSQSNTRRCNERASRIREQRRLEQYRAGEISEAEYTFRQELADAAFDARERSQTVDAG